VQNTFLLSYRWPGVGGGDAGVFWLSALGERSSRGMNVDSEHGNGWILIEEDLTL
jgi:hypothetical protein